MFKISCQLKRYKQNIQMLKTVKNPLIFCIQVFDKQSDKNKNSKKRKREQLDEEIEQPAKKRKIKKDVFQSISSINPEELLLNTDKKISGQTETEITFSELKEANETGKLQQLYCVFRYTISRYLSLFISSAFHYINFHYRRVISILTFNSVFTAI